MFYEKFTSQADLDQHLTAPYFKRFQSYLKANDPIAAQTVTKWQSFH
jgi:quinol monooxygenase YgiN